jgi:23S rRNA (adenine2030-N6)-methyltransferase
MVKRCMTVGRPAMITGSPGIGKSELIAGIAKEQNRPMIDMRLLLCDPSYEMKTDYAKVATFIDDSLRRFATGCYAVWYPQLQRLESRDLPEKLKLLGEMDWLHVSLSVQTPSADGFGMHGSGMFVLNPPWTLPEVLKAELPYLVKALGQDAGARYTLDWRIR